MNKIKRNEWSGEEPIVGKWKNWLTDLPNVTGEIERYVPIRMNERMNWLENKMRWQPVNSRRIILSVSVRSRIWIMIFLLIRQDDPDSNGFGCTILAAASQSLGTHEWEQNILSQSNPIFFCSLELRLRRKGERERRYSEGDREMEIDEYHSGMMT